ncbi:MAG: SDR family oxidoreductase [Chloroflexi bacterium]|nr:SDR family oxidoreductase [Chloroflexota bacterium]OJV92500.1 MAG: short-chain dehydrogenase [Chloroflexi bacterium 54-19]
MQDRVCLVTGANSGVGKATALGLARLGATVVMVCRDRARGEAAQADIKAQTANPSVDLLLADLASLVAVRQLASDFKSKYDRLDVLVNNAGLTSGRRRESVDGLELTLAVNHLAPFLLTNLLLERLETTGTPERKARVVTVSSAAQVATPINFGDLQLRKSYNEMWAYGQSKLANVLFTYELARRLERAGFNVTANTLHPGLVRTNFAKNSFGVFSIPFKLTRPFHISPEKGAVTPLYLAASPEVEGVSGKYFVRQKPRKSAPFSYNEPAAVLLWEESARLTGLEGATI